jgi:hypothetical protein
MWNLRSTPYKRDMFGDVEGARPHGGSGDHPDNRVSPQKAADAGSCNSMLTHSTFDRINNTQLLTQSFWLGLIGSISNRGSQVTNSGPRLTIGVGDTQWRSQHQTKRGGQMNQKLLNKEKIAQILL